MGLGRPEEPSHQLGWMGMVLVGQSRRLGCLGRSLVRMALGQMELVQREPEPSPSRRLGSQREQTTQQRQRSRMGSQLGRWLAQSSSHLGSHRYLGSR